MAPFSALHYAVIFAATLFSLRLMGWLDSKRS